MRRPETPRVKTILGYDIAEGVSVDDYGRWIWDVHVPDLLANPFLDRLVFNTVTRPITTTSAGTSTTEEPATSYRIAELHFADAAAYESYLGWFDEHPIPAEREPAGGTTFRFYALTDSVTAIRDR